MRCLFVFLLGVVVGLGSVCLYHNWDETNTYFGNTVEVKKDCGCTKDNDCSKGECVEECKNNKCNTSLMPPAKD